MKKGLIFLFFGSLFFSISCNEREEIESQYIQLFKDFSEDNIEYNLNVYDSLVKIAKQIDSLKLTNLKELNGLYDIASKFEGIDSVQKITEYRYVDVSNSKKSIRTVNKVLFKLSNKTTLVQVNNFNNPAPDTNIWKWKSLVICNDSLRCILFKSFRSGSRRFAKEKILNKRSRKICSYIDHMIWRENLEQDSISSRWTPTQ